jgi:hypothetical protein
MLGNTRMCFDHATLPVDADWHRFLKEGHWFLLPELDVVKAAYEESSDLVDVYCQDGDMRSAREQIKACLSSDTLCVMQLTRLAVFPTLWEKT